VLGKARDVCAAVPAGSLLTLDDPRLIWWFTRYCQFVVVAEQLRDENDELVTLLQKQAA
jgi:hypothetical protein